MAKTTHINSTSEFNSHISNTEYVVVDFHAVWVSDILLVAALLLDNEPSYQHDEGPSMAHD